MFNFSVKTTKSTCCLGNWLCELTLWRRVIFGEGPSFIPGPFLIRIKKNISSRFSEMSALEMLDNLEEMFPLYHMHSAIFIMFKSHSGVLPVA